MGFRISEGQRSGFGRLRFERSYGVSGSKTAGGP